MSKRTPKLLAATAIAALSYGAWSFLSSDDDPAGSESAELMVNHIWIERLPTDERDMIGFYVPIRHSQGRVGAAGRSSQWRQLADMFLWSLEGDRLQLYFGQERVRFKGKAKAWRCDQNGFDLCLQISDGRHSLLMYSMDEWEIDPDSEEAPEAFADKAPQIADALEDALRSPVDAPADLDTFQDVAALPGW